MSASISSFLRFTIHAQPTATRTGRSSIRRMRRSLLAALVGVALATFLALAATGGAATSTLTVSKVAAPLDGGLYYISPALRKEVKARDLQAVAAPHPGYRLVVLNRLPKGTETAETAANAILAKLKKAKQPSVVDTMKLFTDQVATGKLPAAANSGSSSKGGGFPWIWLIIVAVIGLGVLLALRMRAVSRD